MGKEFVQKNIKLSFEFEKYAAQNPKVYDNIPKSGVEFWIKRI